MLLCSFTAMDPLKHVVYHSSVKGKYTYVLEIKERIPSKYSFEDAKVCADHALRIAESKHKGKLLNIHIFLDDKPVESLRNWKKAWITRRDSLVFRLGVSPNIWM